MKSHSRIRENPLTLAEWREQRPSIPRRYRGITQDAVLGPSKSQARAIHAHCLECMGYDSAAVYDCETHACALWRFRPLLTHGAEDVREQFVSESASGADYEGRERAGASHV